MSKRSKSPVKSWLYKISQTSNESPIIKGFIVFYQNAQTEMQTGRWIVRGGWLRRCSKAQCEIQKDYFGLWIMQSCSSTCLYYWYNILPYNIKLIEPSVVVTWRYINKPSVFCSALCVCIWSGKSSSAGLSLSSWTRAADGLLSGHRVRTRLLWVLPEKQSCLLIMWLITLSTVFIFAPFLFYVYYSFFITWLYLLFCHISLRERFTNIFTSVKISVTY